MKLISIFGLAAVASLSFGQVWNEVGDAGSLPGSAQTTTVGTVTINGSIAQNGDSDMYRFTLFSAATFSATVSGNGTTPLDDSQLFLFNLNGTGIAHNDDIATTNFLSAFAVGNSLYNTLAPGDYLLAISGWDDDAHDGAVSPLYIFATAPGYTGTVGNTVGPNLASRVIGGWDGVAFGTSNGGYSIALTGTAVPEPATMAVLGLGAVALIRRRRARK